MWNYIYFISYFDNDDKTKPLHIMFPKSAFVKCYDRETKWMCFEIEDDDVLEKYNTIYDNDTADIIKEFDIIHRDCLDHHLFVYYLFCLCN